MRYRLKGQPRNSQFVTMAMDVREVAPEAGAVMFRARSPRGLRVLVQLRFGEDGNARWGKSVYVDQTLRQIIVPLSRLRLLGSDGAPPDPAQPVTIPAISRATSLLFVIDLTNALPGSEGTLMVSDVAFARLP
jgi:hypothetical protein